MALERKGAEPPLPSFYAIVSSDTILCESKMVAAGQVMMERQDGYIVEHLIISTEETKIAPETAAKRKD
jgi:hypothetical protein